MEFGGKVAIITGASKGLGRQISLDLARRGAVIVLVARDKKPLETTLEEVKRYSPSSTAFLCDVSDHAKVRDLVKKVHSKFRKIDILINNAGFGVYKDFLESSINDFRSQMETNYFGTLYFSKEVAPIMKDQHHGHIINISSVAGKSGYPLVSGYAASKHAVVGLSEGMYHDLAQHNINVSLICPGAIKDTEFFKEKSFDKFPHNIRHKHAITPDVVSNVVLKALKQKKFEYIVPLRGKIIIIGKNILTEKYMDVVRKLQR